MPLNARTPASVFLYGQPWFERLSPAHKEAIIGSMVLRKAAKGEIVLHRGTPVDGWYGVVAGMLKLQTLGPDGKVSAFLGVPAGEWFGEGLALRREVWRYDVLALRDTTLIVMPLPQFRELHRLNLPFNHYLTERLSLRLSQAMLIIESSRLRTPEERVAQYLCHLHDQGMQKVKLSQEDLGHLAGLSRQTVNRVLKQFETEGWVSLEFGRIDILNHEALDRLVRPVGTAVAPAGNEAPEE